MPIMYIEDAIKEFARRQGVADDALGLILRADEWGRKFIDSLNETVGNGRALSTRQGEFFVNLVNRHRAAILAGRCGFTSIDLDRITVSPAYRREPYESVRVMTEVRYLGDNKLGFRFKKNDRIKESIKRIRLTNKESSWQEDLVPQYVSKHRMWVIPVTASNFNQIMNMIGTNSFDFDDDVLGFLDLCEKSIKQPPSFAYDEYSGRIIVNICDNEPLNAWMVNVMNGGLI